MFPHIVERHRCQPLPPPKEDGPKGQLPPLLLFWVALDSESSLNAVCLKPIKKCRWLGVHKKCLRKEHTMILYIVTLVRHFILHKDDSFSAHFSLAPVSFNTDFHHGYFILLLLYQASSRALYVDAKNVKGALPSLASQIITHLYYLLG